MSKDLSALSRRHFSDAEYLPPPDDHVTADGTGIVSQAGALLLIRALRVTGLDRGLSVALQRWRPGRAVHEPGKIITDLVVALALGGDCLADATMLRAEPALFGPVASDPVISRLVARLARRRAAGADGDPGGAGRRPAAGLGTGRRRRARRRRRPDPGRHRRYDRHRMLGEGAGQADVAENLRLPSPHSLR